MKFRSSNITSFFFILLISGILTFSNSLYQVAVDGGLVLSEIIKYPEPISPLKYYYQNSWTSLNQISEIFLRFGFSVMNVSRILLFISTFFFATASFLIVNRFCNNIYLSTFISIIILILQKNFGDTDYPTLIISNHSYGMFGLAFCSIIFALILNSYNKLSVFFSTLLISLHPVIGLWTLTILIISIILQKNESINKDFLKGSLYGGLVVLLSFIVFFNNSIGKLEFDEKNFQIYMELWDGHRNQTGFIHIEYLVKTLILFTLVNLYFFVIDKNKTLFLKFFNLSIFFSTAIYFFYKIFPVIFPSFLINAMPTRFLILHSFVGWPLIIGILYKFMINYKLKEKLVKIFILFVLIFYSVQHYKNFVKVKDNFIKQLTFKPNNFENTILSEISELNLDGYFITTKSTTDHITRVFKKPVLAHLYSFNFIPYHPYLVDNYFVILKEVYNIDILNPPIKNSTDIPDEFIKNTFEIRSRNDWVLIGEKYNANYVAVPIDWDIKLELFKKNDIFSIYLIN